MTVLTTEELIALMTEARRDMVLHQTGRKPFAHSTVERLDAAILAIRDKVLCDKEPVAWRYTIKTTLDECITSQPPDRVLDLEKYDVLQLYSCPPADVRSSAETGEPCAFCRGTGKDTPIPVGTFISDLIAEDVRHKALKDAAVLMDMEFGTQAGDYIRDLTRYR
jgi:hypothetical protein